MTEPCAFCAEPLPPTPIQTTNDHLVCSRGCQRVYDTLGPPQPDTSHSTQDKADLPPETTYFRIDGMHSLTCETYLEHVARTQPGVHSAEASYITETIRVGYDPDQTTPEAIQHALSHLGYTAYHRDRANDTTTTGPTTRSREISGLRKRRTDHMLGARYIVGIVFGTFLLIPYIVMLYPVYLAELLNGIFSVFENTVQFDSGGGLQVLRVYVIFTLIVLFFTGMPVLRGAIVSLKMRTPTTDLLVTLAVISTFTASIIAVYLDHITLYFDTTVLIAASVTAAIFYESTIKQRALNQLTDLTNSQVATAHRYTETGPPTDVPVEELTVDDRVLIPQGERIPIDGVLENDDCMVDEAIITGESLPVHKHPGDPVIGGSIVVTDAATIRVTETTTSRIDDLTTTVWNLQSATHGNQRHANTLAARALPIIIALALITGLWTIIQPTTPLETLLATTATILVTTPWVLGFTTPLSVATSITDALNRGIVVFDETIFERLRATDMVVFDKTGTLTTGDMNVIDADLPTQILAQIVALERRSSHPAATTIVSAFEPTTDESAITVAAFESHPTGIHGTVNDQHLLIGNTQLFHDHDWPINDDIKTQRDAARAAGQLPVIVGTDGTATGLIVLGDEPRNDWDTILTRLADREIDTVVLTGDDADATTNFRDHPAITHVFSEIQPPGKTATIRRLRETHTVTMIGDGTNDAPALTAADLGIALGGGTALAADAADLAILTNDLTAIETAIDIATAAGRRVTQNNRLALAYNALLIPIALSTALNPLFVVGSALITMSVIAANCSRDLIST